MLYIRVVPYIGTWIETGLFGSIGANKRVVPYIGTWIETQSNEYDNYRNQSYLI